MRVNTSVHEFSPESLGITGTSVSIAAAAAVTVGVQRLTGQLYGGEAVEAGVLAQQDGLLVSQGSSLYHLLPVHPDQVLPHLRHHPALQSLLSRIVLADSGSGGGVGR